MLRRQSDFLTHPVFHTHRSETQMLRYLRELADRDQLYDSPQHPYTQALLSAVPEPDPKVESTRQRILLEGDVPSPANPPKGCNFCTRCPKVMAVCKTDVPEFKKISDGRYVACHLMT